MALTYSPNRKHKPGCTGEGPPRFFPDSASLCPDNITLDVAQSLLEGSIEGACPARPNQKARYAVLAGSIFKGYPEDPHGSGSRWHGYLVASEKVGKEVPARVLRAFRVGGQISGAEYRRMVGSAR